MNYKYVRQIVLKFTFDVYSYVVRCAWSSWYALFDIIEKFLCYKAKRCVVNHSKTQFKIDRKKFIERIQLFPFHFYSYILFISFYHFDLLSALYNFINVLLSYLCRALLLEHFSCFSSVCKKNLFQLLFVIWILL